MSDFFVLLLIAALVAIWFFIKKRPNKKYRNISIVIAMISFSVVGLTNQGSVSDNNASDKNVKTEKVASKDSKQSSSKKKSPNKQKESSSKEKNLNEVKLGMTKDEVVKKFGKPSYQTSRNLVYGKKNIYLVDGKVTGGDYDALQKQVDKKNEKNKKENKTKKIQKNKQNYLTDLYKLPDQTDHAIEAVNYSDDSGVTFVINDAALSFTDAQLKSTVHKIWNVGQNLSDKYSPMPDDMKSTYIKVKDSSGNELAGTSMWGNFKYKAD